LNGVHGNFDRLPALSFAVHGEAGGREGAGDEVKPGSITGEEKFGSRRPCQSAASHGVPEFSDVHQMLDDLLDMEVEPGGALPQGR
jgi:hypothetical protein